MSTQISAPVRILALVGLLGALGMGAWTFLLSKHGTETTSSTASSSLETSSVARNPIAAAHAVAGKLNAHNLATAAGKPDAVTPAKPKVTPAVPKPVHRAKHAAAPAPTKTADGTPTTIAGALRTHRVVVVLLYDPQSKVDAYSLGEAQQGAHAAHAGFLRVNVLSAKQSEPFASAYKVLDTPTVLFFARGGKLVQKLNGFADQESVTQAAVNAAHGIVVPLG